MGKDVNEDLIEATIQRVAAARAAQQGGDSEAFDDQSRDEAPSSASVAPDDDESESVIERTIRRVAAEKAARVARPEQPWEDAEPGSSPEIEATIRRVAAEQAARAAETDEPAAEIETTPEPADEAAPTIVMPVAEAVAPEILPEPREAPRLHAVDDEDESPESAPAKTARGERVAAERTAPQPVASATNGTGRPTGSSPALEAVSRIELGLADTAQTMRTLIDRLDSLLPVLERIADAPATAQATPPTQFNPVQQPQGEWDDVPALPRMPMGQIPRPAIMRDPSPQTATAEHLVPTEAEVIDTRPIPKPLPPLQIEPKRGFDLLPRTYRITVEDKRRGVDLVPLHRALLSMDGVKDMSLLSYNNGVAIVALETLNDLEPDVLGSFVGRAMSRDARVEVHNERTWVVKLAED